jgi:hypothetical protein
MDPGIVDALIPQASPHVHPLALEDGAPDPAGGLAQPLPVPRRLALQQPHLAGRWGVARRHEAATGPQAEVDAPMKRAGRWNACLVS